MFQASNKWGYNLLDFIKVSEEEVLSNDEYRPLTSSLIVINCNDNILICYNIWRKQWEIPAGRIENGETPKECAIRELYEETNQRVEDLEFRGLVKIYDSRKDIVKYQALYYSTLTEIQPFQENNEMDKIMLWNMKDDIGEFDAVDKKIMELCIGMEG